MAAIRVRFAPSPTGNLHLGGFRTALLNYFFAKKNGGKFLLRIEDTDQSRTIPGAALQLEDDLNWLGIKADESPINGGSYGPYTQSERLHWYTEYIKNLIESSSAYECFCSEKRLDLIRKDAMKMKAVPGYDNKCRALTRNEVVAKKAAGESFVIRFKIDQNPIELKDMLYGKLKLTDQHDPVIMKSDGFPTYHYANVVDDHLMEISHVFRGVEWQISTGMHLQMYRAFNWEPPTFGHLPVLRNTDGTKFSKRQGDLSIKNYRDQRNSPICLVNFITKVGGGFYNFVDKLFTMEELISQFDINKLNAKDCRLNFNLLTELNRLHLQNQVEENLEELVAELKAHHPTESDAFLKRLLHWYKLRISTLKDLDALTYLWGSPDVSHYKRLYMSKESLISFTNSEMSNVKDFADAHGLDSRHLMRDIRLILCGLEKGPPVAELFDIFGRDEVKLRCQRAINNM